MSACAACRAELAAMEEAKAPQTVQPLKSVAQKWKKSKAEAFFKGALLVSALAAAACAAAYNAIGSHVEPDGTLAEPFGLIPLTWLFVFLALLFGVCLPVSRLRRKHNMRRIS